MRPFFFAEILWSLLLPPVIGIENRFRLNVKLSAQLFGKNLNTFYLEVGKLRILTVRYDRDVDSLFISPGSPPVIVHRTVHRELFIPFFCRYYLAIVADKTVVDNKMTVCILLAGNAAQRA